MPEWLKEAAITWPKMTKKKIYTTINEYFTDPDTGQTYRMCLDRQMSIGDYVCVRPGQYHPLLKDDDIFCNRVYIITAGPRRGNEGMMYKVKGPTRETSWWYAYRFTAVECVSRKAQIIPEDLYGYKDKRDAQIFREFIGI